MKNLIYLFLLVLLYACGTQSTGEEIDPEKRQYVEQQNPVEVIVLKEEAFKKELVNNGKLVALRKSELHFRVSEQLKQVYVRNGEMVEQGQLIAELEPYSYQQDVKNAEIQLEKAKLDFQDYLMGQGYNTLDSTQIETEIYELGKIKSGYADALLSLNNAHQNMESTRLLAPFSGLVANINLKEYDQVSSGESFCTLIDNSIFEVDFNIVESEMAEINLDDEVQLQPFAGEGQYLGHITEINPVIDEDGLISIKAQVENTGNLMQGMNVKVLVEKDIPGQLVVPKSAVLLRQNQEVLFRYTNGTAYWTYIQTLAENSTSYAVIAHPDKGATLAAGDTVIISGNLNLAHESDVVIE